MDFVTETLPNGNIIEYKVVNGMAYHIDTPPAVVSILEMVRKYHIRVRVVYGDRETGCDWGEDLDTMGYVGRSGGRIKIPLLIHNSRSIGGGAMLDHCIVKIVVTYSKSVLYQHPNYEPPNLEIGPCPEKIGNVVLAEEGYTTGVYRDGQNEANFKSEDRAKRWIAFMRGERMSK